MKIKLKKESYLTRSIEGETKTVLTPAGEIDIDEKQAKSLIGAGWAESAEPEKKTRASK